MGGVEVRSILHSYGLSNLCQIVHWDPLNAKRSSPKNNSVWAMRKMHGFHGNPLYDS